MKEIVYHTKLINGEYMEAPEPRNIDHLFYAPACYTSRDEVHRGRATRGTLERVMQTGR
jgi:hypothetical protein